MSFLRVKNDGGQEIILNILKINTIKVRAKADGSYEGSSMVSLDSGYETLDKESTDRLIAIIENSSDLDE